MKKLIVPAFALAAMIITTTSTKAQDAAATTQVAPPADNAAGAQAVQAQQDEKSQIEIAALPDVVKTTLASDKYKEWVASSAWKVKAADGEYFLVEMKKGDETATIKVDANGNIIG